MKFIVRIAMTKCVTLNVRPDTYKAVLDLMSHLQRESDHVLSIDAVVARAIAASAQVERRRSKRGLLTQKML